MDIDPLPSSVSLPLFVLLQAGKALEFHAPDNWLSWSVIVITAFLCLMMSAFVSGSEIAYFGLTPAEIDELRDDDENPKSVKAYSLINHSEQLLATILISNNLVNITMVVLLTFAINQTVTFNSPVLNFIIQTVALTFLLLLFGEIFPKLVARGRSMTWTMAASPCLMALYKICSPASSVMVKSTSLVNKVVTKKAVNISTDELETALEISDLKEGKDKEMLEGILSFGEKEVSDIMVSRVDVTAIEYHDSWDDVMKVILDSGFSRIPVYDTSQDSIRGVLYSKDLLPYIGLDTPSFEWQKLLREPYYVPESRMIDDLLEDFRKKKIHIAIVIDEYGGTRGIVTLEDIIEEIVGQIDDEYDEEEHMYKKIAPSTFLFDAKVSISDFCRIVGIDEDELGDIGDAETLAGLLLEIKGDFPERKEALSLGRCRFLVIDIRKHRITKVRVYIETKHENVGQEK